MRLATERCITLARGDRPASDERSRLGGHSGLESVHRSSVISREGDVVETKGRSSSTSQALQIPVCEPGWAGRLEDELERAGWLLPHPTHTSTSSQATLLVNLLFIAAKSVMEGSGTRRPSRRSSSNGDEVA